MTHPGLIGTIVLIAILLAYVGYAILKELDR